jgi:hypothetical protein
MNKAVYGIVPTHAEAASLLESLRSSGFSSTDVSVLAPHNQQDVGLTVEKHSKTLEGTATGATAGGVLGGVLGLLAGIGTLAIPGLGILVAAGPLLATLSGMGLGASVGGLAGGLVGLGIPEYEAKLYEGHLEKGGILIAVHCDNSEAISQAQEIMQASGATDVAVSREKAA